MKPNSIDMSKVTLPSVAAFEFYGCLDLPHLTMSQFVSKQELHEVLATQNLERERRKKLFLEQYSKQHNISFDLALSLYTHTTLQIGFFLGDGEELESFREGKSISKTDIEIIYEDMNLSFTILSKHLLIKNNQIKSNNKPKKLNNI